MCVFKKKKICLQALADCKEKSRELEQSRMLVRAVSRDRDLALATLKKHGIPLDKNIQVKACPGCSGKATENFS